MSGKANKTLSLAFPPKIIYPRTPGIATNKKHSVVATADTDVLFFRSLLYGSIIGNTTTGRANANPYIEIAEKTPTPKLRNK